MMSQLTIYDHSLFIVLYSAVTVSIFVFAVGFGRFFNKNRGSRSVSVFMVVYKQCHTRQVARYVQKIMYTVIQ